MEYKDKYLKYKNKYLNLVKQMTGGAISEEHTPTIDSIGINFEGGKIIEKEMTCSNCIAYANCQIAMDAPYNGREAPEDLRRRYNRAELAFTRDYGYSDEKLKDDLKNIFMYIQSVYDDKKIIIQVARGGSAIYMIDDVIKPVLEDLNITNYEIITGYRSTDYYPCDTIGNKKDFIFINIGMFAVLSNVEYTKVGEICNPIETYKITSYNRDTGFDIIASPTYFDKDHRNILNHLSFKKIKLYGIADNMPFVLPSIYKYEHILEKLLN